MFYIDDAALICSLIMGIFLTLYETQKHLKSTANILLGGFLALTFLASCLDFLITQFWGSWPNHINLFLFIYCLKFAFEYLIMNDLCLFTAFNLRVNSNNHDTLVKNSYVVCLIATIITIILCINNKGTILVSTPIELRIVYFSNYLIYYLITCYLIIKAHSILSKRYLVGYFIFAIINIIAMVYFSFTRFILAEYILMTFNAVYLYCIYYTRRNQVDFVSGRFNRFALVATLDDISYKKKPYYFLILKLDGYNDFAMKRGYNIAEALSKDFAINIPQDSLNRTTFRVYRDTFITMFKNHDEYLKCIELCRNYLENPPEKHNDIIVRYIYGEYKDIDIYDTTGLMDLFSRSITYAGIHDCDRLLDINLIINPLKREWMVKTAIQRAIDNDGFDVLYQPIINLHTNVFEKAEALTRLNDEVIGVISPAEFIPLAESSGLIVQVEQQIIRKVLLDFKNYEFDKYGIKNINVNLSPLDLMKPECAIELPANIKRLGLKPEQLVLEITEAVNMGSTEKAAKAMHLLHDAGFEFALDDYGTGYSNISRIFLLPFRYIKYDKSLLDTAMESEENSIIMCHSMETFKQKGYKLVIEGVETEEQANFLKEHGADYIQGFFYSKPLNADDFVKFLKKKNLKD